MNVVNASAAGDSVIVNLGSVTASGANGTGVRVEQSGSGTVLIGASGSVAGSGDGIFLRNTGTGVATIAVSSSVTGGTGAGVAAIRTDMRVGGQAIVGVLSGASVGSGVRNAIVGAAGETSVTVSGGATVTGKISLGAGDDTLIFAGGTFSSVTEIDGGAGSGDTLRFSGGSGSLHATVQSAGLKGWESVVIESGATLTGGIKLADDSTNLTFSTGSDPSSVGTLTGGGGTANTLAFNGVGTATISGAVTGWETVTIGDGSEIRFGANLTAGTLGVTGTLDIGKDSDTDDSFMLTGNLLGGGTVTLNVNLAPDGGSAKDTLTISGSVSNTTKIVFTDIGRALTGNESDTSRPAEILGVVSVSGAASESAFTSDGVTFRGAGYQLRRVSEGGVQRFDLIRVDANACAAVQGTPGAFVCSTAAPIGTKQTLSATGTTALSVTLNSETPIQTRSEDYSATAFDLQQTGGTGGITFTQSATGKAINGGMSAITATNSGGGAIAITVTSTATGAAGDGISATNDASGAGITIAAAAVSGANWGVKAVEDGSGSVKITATGTVTGVSEDGIYAKMGDSGGAIMVTAAAVTGGKTGIEVKSSGSGTITVTATGAVQGTAERGIHVTPERQPEM